MKKKPTSHIDLTNAEEIVLQGRGTGMLVWLLPDDVSEGLRALPREVRERQREKAGERMKYVLLLTLGLLKHPEFEAKHGPDLDRTLSELANRMSELFENPPKPQ